MRSQNHPEQVARAEDYLERQADRAVRELLDFLSIPSVSALPEHATDVAKAGKWVADRLRRAGLQGVATLDTGGHPVVTGGWEGLPDAPTYLIYGHFDTQPADPIEKWTTPPFSPDIRDGRVYARGASDDKGNMLIPILAVEALLQTAGRLPVNVRFLLEGQEEIGSPQLPGFLERHRDLFQCRMVLSADSGQWSDTEPILLLGCRGLCAVDLSVHGPATDLHSGLFGGAVPNPIQGLVRLLGTLHTAEGRIAVPGFYDAVVDLTPAERAGVAALPFDESAYLKQVGAAGLIGEEGWTPLERLSARPTLEMNGIYGGFQGDGTKTVLPASAHAKITCRLVPDQQPDTVAQAVVDHLLRHAPRGFRVEARVMPGSALPYVVPADHPGNLAAADVLREMYGREPYPVRVGGSVPVCELFQRTLGVHTIGFGFGLDDEAFHAPDEFFRLVSFRKGQSAWVRLLYRLAED